MKRCGSHALENHQAFFVPAFRCCAAVGSQLLEMFRLVSVLVEAMKRRLAGAQIAHEKKKHSTYFIICCIAVGACIVMRLRNMFHVGPRCIEVRYVLCCDCVVPLVHAFVHALKCAICVVGVSCHTWCGKHVTAVGATVKGSSLKRFYHRDHAQRALSLSSCVTPSCCNVRRSVRVMPRLAVSRLFLFVFG